MPTSSDHDPIGITAAAASDSLRILQDGFYVAFDAYCQLGLAVLDAWLKAMASLSLLGEPEARYTAEIVRMRPRRA